RLGPGDPGRPGHVEGEAVRAAKELGIGSGRAAREHSDVARAAVRSHPDPEDRAVTRVRDVQVGPARVEGEPARPERWKAAGREARVARPEGSLARVRIDLVD